MMTTLIVNELKLKNEKFINNTYSQSYYLDKIFAKDIAGFLCNQLIFKVLDNGLSLTKIDEAKLISEGINIYTSLAQFFEFSELINFEKIDLIQTGMLDDVIIGSEYANTHQNNEIDILSKAASKKIKEKVINVNLKYEYKSNEIFNFHSRGFSGMNLATPLIFQSFTDIHSPFYDVDFMEYCLSIPLSYWAKHNIYFKWILSKYPDEVKFKWKQLILK